jgi:hypothetical protein
MYNQNFKMLIKDIFSNKWEHNNKILYLSVLLCFSLIAYFILRSGFSMSSDSERYSRWADDLINLDFNLYKFFSIDKASHRPSLFFFSVPVLLIAFCKVIFVNEWQFSFLLLNLSLVFFSLIIFVKILLLIRVRSILISLTLPIIVISVDILTWPRFILSDMIYAFLVFYATHFIIKGIVLDRINYLKFFIIIFLLFASRPSSIPVVVAIISFIIISKFQIFLKKKNILLFVLAIFISIPFLLGLAYLFVEINFSGIAKIDFLTDMVKKGMIIHDRPETWISKPDNFIDIMFIYFLRLINFFNPYASNFSIVHTSLNVIQISIILLSISIWSFFGSHIKIYNKIFLFILLLSFSVAAFHSFILIDYDWRYRFPIILPLIMLFPISLEIILKKNLTSVS